MAKVTIDDFTRELAQALGPRLISFLLYGSAARGAFVPKRSDVNTLLVCDTVDDALFGLLERPVRSWVEAGNPAPFIFTEREWRDSADAYPIEYDDIRSAHRVLAGRDPWNGIVVQREHVRRQLEHELIGKLVHLRQAYAALRGDAGQLAEIIVASAGGFFTMLRATLRLNGVEPPSAPDTLVRAAGGAAGFRAADLDPLVQHVMGVRPLQLRAGDPLPAAYLAAVAATAAYVHRLERKGS